MSTTFFKYIKNLLLNMTKILAPNEMQNNEQRCEIKQSQFKTRDIYQKYIYIIEPQIFFQEFSKFQNPSDLVLHKLINVQITVSENLLGIKRRIINSYCMINLIDSHGKFNQQLEDFPNSSANIAIFGSQSSGKSTLVNSAFNTSFPVLDSKQDRKRCTRGVWLENNGKFNIIDTQGFDSVQRSKDQRIIQRQIALFCLAVADVIIINIWMNQIGRYQGAQIHILRAIINAANYLIESQTKTLLFVIKDCSTDANHEVLKTQLENTIGLIISQIPKKGPKSLKFNIEYYFMSHYIYRRQQFEKQARKLSNLIRVKKSNLSLYESKDRIIYLARLWETIIANEGQIDLRLQQEALRVYVVNRIRNQVIADIQKEIFAETRVGRLNSYKRFYQHFVKKSFKQIKAKLPKYVDEDTTKRQFYLLEEELQYAIQKHFTEIILPNEELDLLDNQLNKQLSKSYNSIKLEKVINQQRKKVLDLYKLLIQGHKQFPILIKRFAEKITQNSIIYERQVSHLFNIFETKLESEINRELDKQLKKIKFEGNKIADKLKTLCKQFQYNQWQVNTKQIWEKASHRILTQRLIQRISQLSSGVSYSIFAGGKEGEIIMEHKEMQTRVEAFVSSLLQYFEQEDTGQQYIENAKQQIRAGLQKALIRQKKRFRLSMLMLGIFLIFCYGEFMLLLKVGGLKKKARKNMSRCYIAVVVIILAASIIKRMVKNSQSA